MRTAASSRKKIPNAAADADADSDWVWGADAIGRLINRSADQVYYIFSTGRFRGAVWKMGGKSLVASRAKLSALPEQLTSEMSDRWKSSTA